jgi:hypothetical protein
MKNSSATAIFKTGIVLLIACSFAGCKKNTVPSAPYYLLSKDGLAYVQFNVGKYFIYKDSVANKTDSIVVTQSLLQTYKGVYSDIHLAYTGQKYTIVETEIDPGSTSVWLSAAADGSGFSTVVLNSIDNGNYIFYETLEPHIPVMVVEGKTYTDVNITSSPYGYGSVPLLSYYWAKGVGLIKRIETIGSVTNTYTLLRGN